MPSAMPGAWRHPWAASTLHRRIDEALADGRTVLLLSGHRMREVVDADVDAFRGTLLVWVRHRPTALRVTPGSWQGAMLAVQVCRRTVRGRRVGS